MEPSVAEAPAMGVRKPIKSARPTTIANNAMIQVVNAAPLDVARAKEPWTIALKATASRRRIRPTPGQPSGKVEKNFCSRCLLGRRTHYR
jgi:hypothetical protein